MASLHNPPPAVRDSDHTAAHHRNQVFELLDLMSRWRQSGVDDAVAQVCDSRTNHAKHLLSRDGLCPPTYVVDGPIVTGRTQTQTTHKSQRADFRKKELIDSIPKRALANAALRCGSLVVCARRW